MKFFSSKKLYFCLLIVTYMRNKKEQDFFKKGLRISQKLKANLVSVATLAMLVAAVAAAVAAAVVFQKWQAEINLIFRKWVLICYACY